MNRTLLAGLITTALAASPVFAHTHLASSVPAAGSTVAAAPAEFVLSFTAAAKLTALSVQKTGGKEQKITALPTASARQAKIPAPKLENGSYTLNWRVVSDDGHVMNGKVNFTVGAKPHSP